MDSWNPVLALSLALNVVVLGAVWVLFLGRRQSQKRAQPTADPVSETLRLEREELGTLMGSISDGIIAVDTERTPLFFNSRFALVFDVKNALQTKDVRLPELFQSIDILDAFEEALKRGQRGAVKAFSVQAPDGAVSFFSLSTSPLRKSNGDIYGAVGIFHDVTDLKSAEQMRIDFVANVSHELRTPLTAIKGYTDTLLEDIVEDRPASPEFLKVIHRNVDRLMALINDLLDLSTLESSDTMQKVRVDTQDFTTRMIAQLQGALNARAHIVEVSFTAPSVWADPRRLEQVLVNLLDNAIKYTPPGGRIRVSWLTESDDIILQVADSGPGIPPEHHPRLFERFYRVDKARSREQGGTGLGLAIVKHIMQRHEGTVSIESTPPHGATFECRFPGAQ